ncbi:MAG: gamma-glutamylcyclotransferase family protein [Acidimicrobiales bacterium]
MTDLLFAYGTLLPGDVRWHFLQPFVVDEGTPDVAPGWLYDTGEGYPAARFGELDGSCGSDSRIQGRVFRFVAARLDEALRVLDDVERAVAGDYRRVRVVTDGGHQAWAYAYGGGLELEPIDDGSWVAHLARRRA